MSIYVLQYCAIHDTSKIESDCSTSTSMFAMHLLQHPARFMNGLDNRQRTTRCFRDEIINEMKYTCSHIHIMLSHPVTQVRNTKHIWVPLHVFNTHF